MAIENYQLFIGFFEGEDFKWKKIKSFDSYESGLVAFKNFVREHLEMDEKDLSKKWNTPRIDVELMMGDKLIQWAGIYNNSANDDEKNKPKKEKEIVEEDEVVEDADPHENFIRSPLKFRKDAAARLKDVEDKIYTYSDQLSELTVDMSFVKLKRIATSYNLSFGKMFDDWFVVRGTAKDIARFVNEYSKKDQGNVTEEDVEIVANKPFSKVHTVDSNINDGGVFVRKYRGIDIFQDEQTKKYLAYVDDKRLADSSLYALEIKIDVALDGLADFATEIFDRKKRR